MEMNHVWHYCSDQLALIHFLYPSSNQARYSLPGLLRRWRGRMIGCYRQQRKAAVGTTTTTTTSRPAVLLSVCLSVFVVSERQLTVEVRVGWVHAGGNAFESTPSTAATIIIMLCFGAVEETTTGWFGFVFVEQREARRRAVICHFNIGVLRHFAL